MKKATIVLVLAVLVSISFSACGWFGGSSSSSSAASGADSAAVTTSGAVTDSGATSDDVSSSESTSSSSESTSNSSKVSSTTSKAQSQSTSSAKSNSKDKGTTSQAVSSSSADQSSASGKSSAISKDQINYALSNAKKVKSEVQSGKASGEADQNKVTITVDSGDVSDLTGYLKTNQEKSAAVFEQLFANPAVQTVVYVSKINIKDTNGRKKSVVAQTNTMQAADAAKVAQYGNWHGFSTEKASLFYSVVHADVASDAQVSGIQKAWEQAKQ